MLKLSPDDKQGSCSGPIEKGAWSILASTRSPRCTHWFQGWGWYSSTWQAKEKQTWSLIIIVQVHLFFIYNFITIIMIGNVHHHHFSIITSDLEPPPTPPFTLSLPPTIEAWASHNVLGREAIGVQAVAPGRRVSTEDPSSPPYPPAIIKSCTG